MKALFDTNLLIDYLNGEPRAAEEIRRYGSRIISRITWMEVLVGVPSEAEQEATRRFLDGFRVVEITPEIAEAAVKLRRDLPLKLPDAFILASARENGCLLVTRNTKDFDPTWPEVRVPYTL